MSKPVPITWPVFDLSRVSEWQIEPVQFVVDGLISKGGMGFLAGAPKGCKSLEATDLTVHLAHAHNHPDVKWLGRFRVEPARVLYVAREDPAGRIKERTEEINRSYGYGPMPADVAFVMIRERINLMDARHTAWIADQVREKQIDFLILDVLNRMTPGLDELSAKDMARMVSVLEALNRDLALTILLLDHTRKPMSGPKSGRDQQEPNPFDLKGSVAKYGMADFMLCLSRTEQPGRLQMYCENKDTDERPHFLIDVSPKGSGKPKFQYAGDVQHFADDMKAVGDTNRNKVLETVADDWTAAGTIEAAVGLSSTTVRDHLKRLEEQGKVQREGKGKGTRYRRVINGAVQGRFGDNWGNGHE